LNKFQRDERKGEDLTAVDLFKATHNSSKNGFSEAAKDAIVSQTFLSTEGVQYSLFAAAVLHHYSNLFACLAFVAACMLKFCPFCAAVLCFLILDFL
jgi:hypothetical protein